MRRLVLVSLSSATALVTLLLAIGIPDADAQLDMVEANRPTSKTGEIGDPNKCLAGKVACVRVLESSLQKCAELCTKKPDKRCYEAERVCKEKASEKFTGGDQPENGCFAKLEAKQDRAVAHAQAAGQTTLSEKEASTVCVTRGDAEAVFKEFEAYLGELQQTLEPNYVPGAAGVNGFSFFLGTPGQSCDDVCTSKGLPFDLAGTDAFAAFSQQGCRAVLEAVPGSPCASLNVHEVAAPGCGCGVVDEPSPAGEPVHCVRDVAQPANATCAAPGLSRVCACKNDAPDPSTCPASCVRLMANVLFDTTGFPFPPTATLVCDTKQTTIQIYHGVALPPHYDWIDIRPGGVPDSWVCRVAVGGFDAVEVSLTKTQREACSRIAAPMIDAMLGANCRGFY